MMQATLKHFLTPSTCTRLPTTGYPAGLTPEGLQPIRDDANLAWKVSRQQQLTAWGSDLFCPSPAPLFQLQLLLRDNQLQFVPSLAEVQHTVLGCLDAILQAGQSVEDLGAKVRAHQYTSYTSVLHRQQANQTPLF